MPVSQFLISGPSGLSIPSCGPISSNPSLPPRKPQQLQFPGLNFLKRRRCHRNPYFGYRRFSTRSQKQSQVIQIRYMSFSFFFPIKVLIFAFDNLIPSCHTIAETIFKRIMRFSLGEQGPTFDIKLPRRSLLVQFTCDSCGERTQRLINRLAYERGLVYVQCAGCQRHHKLVDNLGLVVEYDLREETSAELDGDEVS